MNRSHIRNPSPSNDQSYRNVMSKSPDLVILYQSIGPVHLPSLRCWVPIPRQLPVSIQLSEKKEKLDCWQWRVSSPILLHDADIEQDIEKKAQFAIQLKMTKIRLLHCGQFY